MKPLAILTLLTCLLLVSCNSLTAESPSHCPAPSTTDKSPSHRPAPSPIPQPTAAKPPTPTQRYALLDICLSGRDHQRPDWMTRLPHLLLAQTTALDNTSVLRLRQPDAPGTPAPFTLRITPLFPDFQTETHRLNGMDISNKTCTLTLDYEVIDRQGSIITADTVSVTSRHQSTSAVVRTGVTDELLKACLKALPQKFLQNLSDRLTVTCAVTLVGPKGDTAFQPEQATILIDGEPLADDAPVKLAKGLHTIDVLLDGYTQTVRQFNLENRANAIRIVMRRARAH